MTQYKQSGIILIRWIGTILQILLLKDPTTRKWELPYGGKKRIDGNKPFKTMKREFFEECGFELPWLTSLESFKVYNGKSITYKAFFKSNNRYLTQENSWKLHHKGKEHTEARWVSVSDFNLTKQCFFGGQLRGRTVMSLKYSGLF